MTLVTYFFQGEPGESLTRPNAFLLPGHPSPSSRGVTLGQFLESFPSSANARGGRLHFRFRAEDAKLGYVWQDISTPTAILPTYNGQITAKVLCLDAKIAAQRVARLRRKHNMDYGAEEALQASSSSSTSRVPGAPSSSSSSSSTAQAKASAGVSQAAPQDLMDFDMMGGGEDVGPSPRTSSVSSTPAVSDFATMSALDIDSSSSSGGAASTAAGGKQLNREELVARREAAIQEKVNQALEFKQELDENQKREGEELEAAKLKHDKILTEWAFDQSKKKRNVRTLLTTMHKVLWPDNSWKAIGLGDVIEPKKVKLQFRKAMLVVHPDRCNTMSAENRFIGKRIFEGINDSYQEFLKSEQPDG